MLFIFSGLSNILPSEHGNIRCFLSICFTYKYTAKAQVVAKWYFYRGGNPIPCIRYYRKRDSAFTNCFGKVLTVFDCFFLSFPECIPSIFFILEWHILCQVIIHYHLRHDRKTWQNIQFLVGLLMRTMWQRNCCVDYKHILNNKNIKHVLWNLYFLLVPKM